MKRVYIILIILIIVSACKKDDPGSQPNETNLLDLVQLRLNYDSIIEENDTIYALVQYKYSFGTIFVDSINHYPPTHTYEDYTFEWNINDEVTYIAAGIGHSFQSNGIKKITLTVKYKDKKRIITYYVQVFGCVIASGSDERTGFFIDESDNSHRTIFTREGNDMVGYEYSHMELQSRKILDQNTISYFQMVDFSKDINEYLNLWTGSYFYKYDKHADLIFEISSFSGLEYKGSIYMSSEGKHFIIGSSSYSTMLYGFDQDGGNFFRDTLKDNAGDIKYKDAVMLTDNTCIVLVENANEGVTRLVKINLNTNEENTLMVLPENYNRIKRTKEGFILYIIGEKSIAYFNQDLDLLWNIEVELHSGFAEMRHREFQDNFLIINAYELLSISKSGELNLIKEYDPGSSFVYGSITESSQHALILAGFKNYGEGHANNIIMYLVDEKGNYIE